MRLIRVFIEKSNDGRYSAYMPDDNNLPFGLMIPRVRPSMITTLSTDEKELLTGLAYNSRNLISHLDD